MRLAATNLSSIFSLSSTRSALARSLAAARAPRSSPLSRVRESALENRARNVAHASSPIMTSAAASASLLGLARFPAPRPSARSGVVVPAVHRRRFTAAVVPPRAVAADADVETANLLPDALQWPARDRPAAAARAGRGQDRDPVRMGGQAEGHGRHRLRRRQDHTGFVQVFSDADTPKEATDAPSRDMSRVGRVRHRSRQEEDRAER